MKSTRLLLNVYKPRTLFSAQVNDPAIAKGAISIAYDNASGSYTDIYQHCSMYIGSAPGLLDMGKIRVRSADASSIIVAENSDVAWADDLYLTVINFVEVWPIYPKVNVVGTTMTGFKDGDIAYTNQNDVCGQFIRMGLKNGEAAILRSGSVSVYFSSSGTVNVAGNSMTFSWVFEGGTPGTSSSATPGWVTWDTPGDYHISLTVTAGGAAQTSHRFLSVRNETEFIRNWEYSGQMTESRKEGEVTCSVRVYDQLNEITDGALVSVITDGAPDANHSNLFFSGYILKGSVQYNYADHWVEFDVGGISSTMKLAESFAVSVKHTDGTPTSWFYMNYPTPAKSIFHILYWHSTVLHVCDFAYTGPAWNNYFFDTQRTDLYTGINDFLKNGLHGELSADRQGMLWAELSAGAIHDPLSVLPVLMTMNKSNWMNTPNIDDEPFPRYSYLEIGGFAWLTSLIGCAPGVVPSFRGKDNREEGAILDTQSQLNTLVGDVLAYQNSRYPAATFDMADTYTQLVVAPLGIVQLNIDAGDTPLGIVFVNKPFHIAEIKWKYTAKDQSLVPTVEFAEITQGQGATGDTIPVPPTPPNATEPPVSAVTVPVSVPSYTWPISNPTAVYPGYIPGPTMFYPRTAVAVTCYILGTGSVTFNIEMRTSFGSSGVNLFSSNIVATGTIQTVLVNNPSLPLNAELLPIIVSTSGAPTFLKISLEVM